MRLRISSYFPVMSLVYISRGRIKRHICCWHRSTHLACMYFFSPSTWHHMYSWYVLCLCVGRRHIFQGIDLGLTKVFLHFWVSTTYRDVTKGPCWLFCPRVDQIKLKSVLEMSLVAGRRQTDFDSRWDAHLKRSKEHDFLFFFFFPLQGAYKSSTICYSPEKGTWTELEGEVAEPLAGPACSTVILPACLPFNKWQLTVGEGKAEHTEWGEDHP